MDKVYMIESKEGSKSYQITTYKKQKKCVMCSKPSKTGNLCSIGKKQPLEFVCSDCLESIIHQYNTSKNKSLKQFIKEKITRKLRDNKAPNTKCRLCGEIIKITQWRSHLTFAHHSDKDVEFRDFFVRPNIDVKKANNQWYNPDSSNSSIALCGTKVNGGPEARVIFNATFSNRRKF